MAVCLQLPVFSATRLSKGRIRLALIGFVFHAPGLWILAKHELSRRLKLANAIAITLTLAMMAVAAVLADPGSKLIAALLAWLAGHFAWSFVLAAWILLSAKTTRNREATR